MSRRRVVVKQQKQAPNPMAAAMKDMQNMDDMPRVPVRPNKEALFCIPGNQEHDYSRYVIIWPNSFNSNKTVAQGRRIAKKLCCPDPVPQDISEVCSYLMLWHVIEPYRGYPREPYVLGRIRVRLTLPDGRPANPGVPTRKALMKKLGASIPSLESRKKRLAEEKAAKEKALKEEQSKKAAQITAATGGRKKKGKKKKGR